MTQPLESTPRAAGATVSAEVRAHERVVRYSRVGNAGPDLLLLVTDSSSTGLPDFARLLAERFRLMIPDLPAAQAEAGKAVRSLLDGLGCLGIDVLAAGRHCDVGLELALAHDESVGQVVLIPEEMSDEGVTGVPAGSGGRSMARSAPIHVIPPGLSSRETAARVTDYLVAARRAES